MNRCTVINLGWNPYVSSIKIKEGNENTSLHPVLRLQQLQGKTDVCLKVTGRKTVIIFFFSIHFLILNQNFICINSSNMYVLTRTLPVYKCILFMFANEWFPFNFLKFLSSNSQVAPWFSLFGHREWEEKRWLFCQCIREEIQNQVELFMRLLRRINKKQRPQWQVSQVSHFYERLIFQIGGWLQR